MGFNTVAFLLNDFGRNIESSPKTVAWALSHPLMCDNEKSRSSFQQCLDSLADEYGEPRLHSQALEVIPTFHADCQKFFYAGRNNIAELQFVRYGVNRKTGKRTVTVELPDWFRR